MTDIVNATKTAAINNVSNVVNATKTAAINNVSNVVNDTKTTAMDKIKSAKSVASDAVKYATVETAQTSIADIKSNAPVNDTIEDASAPGGKKKLSKIEQARRKKKQRIESRNQKMVGKWDYVLSDCLARDMFMGCSYCPCFYPCSMSSLDADIRRAKPGCCGCVLYLLPCVCCCPAAHVRTMFRNKNRIPGGQLDDCTKTMFCPYCAACQIANQFDLNEVTREEEQHQLYKVNDPPPNQRMK